MKVYLRLNQVAIINIVKVKYYTLGVNSLKVVNRIKEYVKDNIDNIKSTYIIHIINNLYHDNLLVDKNYIKANSYTHKLSTT